MNNSTGFIITISTLLVLITMSETISHDLVNIQAINPKIIIEIRYATNNNFTGKKLYSHPACFARKTVADKLHNVQKYLDTKKLRLKIWDAYRPQSVQYKLWQLVPDERYVMDPKKGSRHSRGAAVDVTLTDAHGKELLMPTEFDNFTQKAHRNYKNLPKEAIKNRDFLEKVMTAHGFVGLPTEWWHFDDKEWHNFNLLDISFEDLVK